MLPMSFEHRYLTLQKDVNVFDQLEGGSSVMVNRVSQRPWCRTELLREGLEPDERIKHLIMARTLTESEAPKRIITSSGQEIIARAGDIICYRPGNKIRAHLDSYEHWSVEPGLFAEAYRAWDQPLWMPSPAEKHLMEVGCLPYYKIA